MWHGLQVGLNSGKKGNLKTELLWISKRHSRSNIDLSINELPYTLILLDLRLCDVAPSIWKSCPRNLSPKEKRKKQSFSLLDTWKWLNSCFWRSEFGSNLFFWGGGKCNVLAITNSCFSKCYFRTFTVCLWLASSSSSCCRKIEMRSLISLTWFCKASISLLLDVSYQKNMWF